MAVSTLQMPTVVEESSIREQHSPVSTNTANILSHPTKRRRTLHRRRRQIHHLQQQQSKIHQEDEEDDELVADADIEEEKEDEEEDDDDDVQEVNDTTIAAVKNATNGIEVSVGSKQQPEQLYSLRWHDFQTSILSSFRHLRDVEDFVDVTLACDGKSFTAHKMVLSACSPYFRHLLKANPCQHPIVILRDVKYRDMEALLRFMYNGEVSVSNDQLPSVLLTARMLQVKGLADVPSKHYPNKRVSDYSNETPSSRESSTERDRRLSVINPPRKRARSRSKSPVMHLATAAAVVEDCRMSLKAVTSVFDQKENGLQDDDDDDDRERRMHADDDDSPSDEQKQQQQLLMDVHRESLLSQALEGRSSQSLMAHLLATRRSNNSETSSTGIGGGVGDGGIHSSHNVEDDDDASDSDDTDASDRDRTDVGDLSNTEDNVYSSPGMMGDSHRSSMHHHSDMMPPSGYAHHPLLNLQSLHSLFPPGSIHSNNGSSGGGHHHHHSGSGGNNNNSDLAQATRRSLDLMRIRATDPRPCPQCGKIYRSAHTLRTHLEDKHTVCPGYRCVLCGTVAKSRNSLHSHMSRQHRGISTKDLPVVPMPAPFDPVLASCLLAKAGVKVSPAELAARASPTSGNPRGRTADLRLDFKGSHSGSLPPGTIPPQVTIGGLQSHRNNPLQLIPLDQDPEDLSLAQQRLRGESGHREKGSGGGMTHNSPYGSAAAGLVNRLGLSTKMGKHWLESNMAAMQQQQQQQQSSSSPGNNHNASGGGGGSTGSALLDTYLQLIAEHSSNMAAAAAAAAAAQNAPSNNNHPESAHRGVERGQQDSPPLLETSGFGNDKRSPKATAGD